ncbi:calcium-binding protein [Puniceibacterium sp. IMCC21224]|uniref:calcium-binding protein n=1 Tax=Puniceibacterium sp. IMCC21224 TaxID=1618204 RepID=UPI00065D6B0E|nr:calcium-binding protein [Puniceibacterium sp. IMCC21224]KMK65637.1 hypothetical protein IMCC21224_11469 [Puniceibacterium sp. IMCC21224]
MVSMLRLTLAVFFGLLACQPAWAQGRDGARVYAFGNSLMHHLGDLPDSNVPHWLNALAQADGRAFALDGQWGFLRDFASGLPPTANWGFPEVQGAWNPDRGPFGGAGFDTVLINPANFIQYQPPDAPYDGDNRDRASPLSATLEVFDWVSTEAPEVRFLIYEGWAEMATQVSYPPNSRGLRRYQDFNRAAYHDWYVDYVDALRAALPDRDVRLIPVASVLAEVLSTEPLIILPAQALYVDDAPHGTPTLYFLAAMVTYAAIYDAPPPADFDVPEGIDPAVRAAYPQLRQLIWQSVSDDERQSRQVTGGDTIVADAAPQPPTGKADTDAADAPDMTEDQLVPGAIPALAMGLNGISDWSTQHPFVDVMKTARTWTGHKPGQWGGMDEAALRNGGYLDLDGWPLDIPPGIERIETVILTDQPPGATHLSGTYVLTYQGRADITLTGRADRISAQPGKITFQYTPGEGLVGISLSGIDARDPIHDMHVVRADHLPLYEAGVLFNPDWIARVQDLRAVRFMDWMFTNGSSIATWDDRPRLTDYSWTSRGVPIEVMVALANQIGVDPWFSMPHLADDGYVRSFAQQVHDTLDPRLMAYVEYSNEVWNYIFPQAHWASAQATALWGESETGWMQFYGLRAAQVMDLWSEVFAADASARLMRIMSTHTGWPGLEEAVLRGPLAAETLGQPPQDSFDAYAVSGYFGYEIGIDEGVPQVRGWLDASEGAARKAGEALGLTRVALREYILAHRFDLATAPVAGALRDGSVAEMVGQVWPYHARAAQQVGLDLIMYEGGTHVSAAGEAVNDDRLTAFFEMFNYSPQMTGLYDVLLAGWTAAGGQMFNAFVDVAPPSKWGSWGALRHLNDKNPRWDALMRYNARGAGDQSGRAPAAFSNGVLLQADSSGAILTGTPQADILLGGPGDDVLISAGGADHLHGGAGQDRAVLPGQPDDYAFEFLDTALMATGPAGPVMLAGIEVVGFDASDSEITMPDGP